MRNAENRLPERGASAQCHQRGMGSEGGQFPALATRMEEDLAHRRRKAKDIRKADAEWFGPVLDRWLTVIGPAGSHGDAGDDERFLAALAAGMASVLSMRDAVIVSLVSDVGRDQLLAIAAKPHARMTSALVGDALTRAFNDPSVRPDRGRCERGLETLLRIVRADRGRHAVQPLGAMAYVLWWMGEFDQSMGCALRALAIDAECTLARIMLGCAMRGVLPAWLEHAMEDGGPPRDGGVQTDGVDEFADEFADGFHDGEDEGADAYECCACAECGECAEFGCECGECCATGSCRGAAAMAETA